MNVKTILFLVCFQCVFNIGRAQWDSVGQNSSDKSKYLYTASLCVYKGNLISAAAYLPVIGDVSTTQWLRQWNGTRWDTIKSGVGNAVDLLVYNENLIALGSYGSYYVGQWNGAEWSTVGSSLHYSGQWGVYLNTLGQYNGKLYMSGGNFLEGNVLRLDSSANWYNPFLNDFNVRPEVYAMTVYQDKQYLGGSISAVGGISNIASWNDTVLTPVGGGINSYGVDAMIVWNGKLYVGGNFDSAGGQPANNIAVWDGSHWSSLGKGINGGVGAFAIYQDTLIVGGCFDSAGGIACNDIAKFDGISWHPMGKGITPAKTNFVNVNTLCVYNGALYVGGQFDSAGGIYAHNIARWGIPDNTDTASYTGTLVIYPNPGKGLFNLVIASEAKQSPYTLEVYNALGQKIYNSLLSPGTNEINLTNESSGVYLYKVSSTNGSILGEGKLVIEH